jgi:hypothetical protein
MIWASRFAAQRFALLACVGLSAPSPFAPAAHAGGSATIPLALDGSQKIMGGSAKSTDGSAKRTVGSKKSINGSKKIIVSSSKSTDGSQKIMGGSAKSMDGSAKSTVGSAKSMTFVIFGLAKLHIYA